MSTPPKESVTFLRRVSFFKTRQNTVNSSQGGCLFVFGAAFVGHAFQTNKFINDPTAGSPTVTLLRLLLPLNDQV